MQKRKPARLKNFDYSQNGAYFVTICTHNKRHLFGKIYDGKMYFTDLGSIVENEILNIEMHYQTVRIDKYVVMPNHIHMIIVISEAEGMNPFPTKMFDISNVVGKFKAGVSRIVGNGFIHSVEKRIWQSSYHDHIIRGGKDYKKIWEYIDTNVIRWEEDCFYDNDSSDL